MAKTIDKQTMLNLIIEAKRTDPETGSFAEWLAEYLAEHLPTITPPNEWVSVEERLPEMHKDVLALYTYGKIMISWRNSDDLWLLEKLYGPVTHWMPLPAPPDRRPPEGEA